MLCLHLDSEIKWNIIRFTGNVRLLLPSATIQRGRGALVINYEHSLGAHYTQSLLCSRQMKCIVERTKAIQSNWAFN